MSTQIQRRRGTTAQHSTFTGAVGEVTVDTDKEVLVVHDGAQAGGYPQMRENGSNSALALGSAGTPSLKFSGDPNTGIYSPGADQVAISTNGTVRLLVNANGSLGVGTVTPADNSISIYRPSGFVENRIQSGSTNFSAGVDANNIYVGSASTHPVLFTVNSAERMRLDSSGRLGVGNTSPGSYEPTFSQLVVGSSGANGITIVSDTASNGNIAFADGTAGLDKYRGYIQYIHSTNALAFGTDGAERFRVDSSGRLGLGSSNPDAQFVISNTSRIRFPCNAAQNAISFWKDATPTFAAEVGLGSATGLASALKFDIYNGTSWNTAVNIDSSSRVGIGTASPSSLLHVERGSITLNATSPSDTHKLSWKYSGTEYAYIERDIANGGLVFGDNTSQRMKIDSSGRLLVGTSTGSSTLTINGTANISGATVLQSTLNVSGGGISNGYSGTQGAGNYLAQGQSPQIMLQATSGGTGNPYLYFKADGANGKNIIGSTWDSASPNLIFEWAGNEKARITSDGSIYARGATDTTISSSGTKFVLGGSIGGGSGGVVAQTNNPVVYVNRNDTDGDLVIFYQAGTQEGSISVSGTTVSYNGAHLSRWSQLPGGAIREEIFRGTVLSNIDEMCGWGDEDNEQLNRMKVSNVEGDPNVAGVFQGWDDDDDTYTDDFYCAMTGDFIIRIAEGVTIQRGDLLMSAGDGTAKPQDDDIIRSKTIAKVTSTHVTCTYDDGSYCVPCVLMAC